MTNPSDVRHLVQAAKAYLQEHGRDPELETLVERVEYQLASDERGVAYDHG